MRDRYTICTQCVERESATANIRKDTLEYCTMLDEFIAKRKEIIDAGPDNSDCPMRCRCDDECMECTEQTKREYNHLIKLRCKVNV